VLLSPLERGGGVAIGRSSTTQGGGIAIGHGSSALRDEFVAGSSNISINDVYFGKGKINTLPTNYSIHGTGASGTDIDGGGLTLAGGLSTGTGAGGDIIFQTANGGLTSAITNNLHERMRITDIGNIGIGFSIPGAALDVNGSIFSSGFRLQDGTQANGYVLTSDANGLASWLPAPTGGSTEWTDNGTTLYPNEISDNIAIGGTTSAAPIFMDASTGTVNALTEFNAGTAATYTEYSVARIWSGNSSYAIQNNVNDTLWMKQWNPNYLDYIPGFDAEDKFVFALDWNNNSANGGEFVFTKNTSAITFNGDSSATLLAIKENGNIGIGTYTPQAKLDIIGNIKITDGTQSAGFVLTSDANGLASWQAPSGVSIFTNNLGQTNSEAFGNGATLSGIRSTVFGNRANADSYDAVAIGYNADADGFESLAIGSRARTKSGGWGSVALGFNAMLNGDYGVAIGPNAYGAGQAISIGRNSINNNVGGITIGANTTLGSNSYVAIGNSASGTGNYAVAIGPNSNVAHNRGLAILGITTAHSQVVIGGSNPLFY
jgi:hypothetical protein